MRSEYFILAVALAGLLVGALAYQLTQQKGYCQQVGEEIRQQSNFNGTIACYPPDQVSVNVTDSIENRTELRCVCQNRYMGNVRTFTINVAD